MDVVSHGLWGGIAFGRRNKGSFLFAFLAGVLPDFLAFGPHFINSLVNGGVGFRHPEAFVLPGYIYQVYSITHSLVIFTVVFGLIWLLLKRPVWELGAWGLHILMDIPTHSEQFFPTPFLWPLSSVSVNGHSWGTPEIFIPNVAALLFVYLLWWSRRRKTAHAAGY